MDNWTYSKTFELDENTTKANRVWLLCHGIDTVANIRFLSDKNGG